MVAYRNSALDQYHSSHVDAAVSEASPHRQIAMLFEGALRKINSAGHHLREQRLPHKARELADAVKIVEGLRMSLDAQRGGELAQRLEELYDYVCRRLTQANSTNDPVMLDECAALLRQIKEGWDAIADPTAAGQVQ